MTKRKFIAIEQNIIKEPDITKVNIKDELRKTLQDDIEKFIKCIENNVIKKRNEYFSFRFSEPATKVVQDDKVDNFLLHFNQYYDLINSMHLKKEICTQSFFENYFSIKDLTYSPYGER